ncbi:uncharacterized [Tachysurus ichikawai]
MSEASADDVMDGEKRVAKPTVKALAYHIESLQKQRKTKVNKIKELIPKIKNLMRAKCLSVGSHLCCGARGAVGGSVPCSRAPQSWPARDSNPQPSGYESDSLTIRPPENQSSISERRSGVSSISSVCLKAEAELAALKARQKLLKDEHELEDKEEQLRKRKEQLNLQGEIEVQMAKLNVLKSECVKR